MSSITNDQLLEHNFVNGIPNDNEQDILDEFLDQRVYESINLADSHSIKVETDDLLNDFYNNDSNDSNNNNNDGSNYGSGNGNYLLNQSQTPTPNNDYMYLDNASHNTNNNSVYTSPTDASQMNITNTLQLSDYEIVRDDLSKLKFGTTNMNPCPSSVDVPDPSYLDFSQQAMDSLPYKLTLTNLPSYSRVETQIKFKFGLSPPPPHVLLHIPQDLISKNKFCLANDLDSLAPTLKENLLYLDTYVLTSDYRKSCNICPRCIKREQKRASRRKCGINGNESDGNNDTNNDTNNDNSNGKESWKASASSWADEKMMKKAIIFNCKEIVSFPPPNGLNNDLSKSLDLSARIICYCRHHKESQGFKLLFVVKNDEGKVVAKQISSTVMIMDRKKTTAASKVKANEDSLPNSVCGSTTNLRQMSRDELQQRLPKESDNDVLMNSFRQLSSNSIDESNSEAQTNTDTNAHSEGRNLKRKKLSVDDSYNTLTNPMFNGSVNALSPLSNSDTNTSTSNMLTKPNTQLSHAQHHQPFGLSPLSHPQLNTQQPRLPSIQRIIPAQGPIRGGIEITLLGFNFRQGLAVKFGANQALATHCWSETTLVTYLPPTSQPGQVLVSFEDHEHVMIGGPPQQQIFTYTDDTDKQLIELALQIVGLKMNGKLEDAKNIAKRIVGTDNSNISGTNTNVTSPTSNQQSINQANIEWFDNAHKAVEQLAKSDLSTEEILINFLSLVDLPNCPIIIPNWQLCNGQGQTLLHLASLKKYKQLIKFLITHGSKIDVKDNQGLTPLFLASMCGHRDLIQIFIACKSNWNLKLSNDKLLKDYCDLNVLDIFNNLEEDNEYEEDDFSKLLSKDSKLSKSMSLDSLNSMFAMNFGCHVSKMVIEDSVNHSAGSKLESGDRHIMSEELNSRSRNNNNNANFEASHSDSELADSELADSEFESNDDDKFYNDDYYESESDDDYDEELDNNINDNSELGIVQASNVVNEDQSLNSDSTILQPLSKDNDEDDEGRLSLSSGSGLWQKVKKVFSNNESDTQLPSYDDLFPFGPSSFHLKPKSSVERSLNNVDGTASNDDSSKVLTRSKRDENHDDAGVSSDSSEDMVISYINHPRKTVENDKMLLFFWFPVLVSIVALVFFVSIMGYKFEFIENFKHYIRTSIGNLMIGNERIGRLFQSSNGVGVERMLLATRRMINE